MSRFHVLWKGQRSGPYTEEELVSMINAGSVGSLHTILEDDVPSTLEDFVAARYPQQDQVYAPLQEPELEPPDFVAQNAPAQNYKHKELSPPPPPQISESAETFVAAQSGGIVVYRGMRRIGEFSMSSLAEKLREGTLLPDDCLVEGTRHIPLDKIFPRLQHDKSFDAQPRARVVGAAASEDHVYDLRMATSYRSFRSIIKIVSILAFTVAVLGAVAGGLSGGLAIQQGQTAVGWGIIVGSVAYGGVIVVAAIFWREFCTIIADIGDCNLRKELRGE